MRRNATAAAHQNQQSDTCSRVPLNILLVEDDPSDAAITQTFLSRSRYFECSITHADDMPSARNELQKGGFDVIILDYWMRAQPSLKIIGNSDNSVCHTPFIVISSVDEADVQGLGFNAGAMSYLHKNDVSGSTLDAVLRTLFHTRIGQQRLRQSLISKSIEDDYLQDKISEMAHEVITTLESIQSFARTMETITEDPSAREAFYHYPQFIKKGSERLLILLHRYLSDIDKKRASTELSFEPTDVCEIARSAVQATAGRCNERRQNIDFLGADPGPSALVDGVALYQVVVNLVTNASKFSPIGSPIRVAVRDYGAEVHIMVVDQGEGMTDDEIATAMQRHARVIAPSDLVTAGKGLGLAIVTSIVDLHGGTIEFESRKRWGSTVTVRLPKERPTVN
jgi:signal transduction histidine kinase